MQKKKPWSTGKIAITTTLLTVIGGGIFMLTNSYLNSNANKNISKEGSPKIDSINTVPPNNKIEVTNNGQGSQNNEIVIGTKSIQNYNVNKTKDSPRLKIQSPIIYIDEKVTSTNQQGGITAHTVVIPEDKTVDLKDNYLVTEYQLGATWGNRKGLQLKPKQGVWNVPFIAIPLTESEKVDIAHALNDTVNQQGFRKLLELNR